MFCLGSVSEIGGYFRVDGVGSSRVRGGGGLIHGLLGKAALAESEGEFWVRAETRGLIVDIIFPGGIAIRVARRPNSNEVIDVLSEPFILRGVRGHTHEVLDPFMSILCAFRMLIGPCRYMAAPVGYETNHQTLSQICSTGMDVLRISFPSQF